MLIRLDVVGNGRDYFVRIWNQVNNAGCIDIPMPGRLEAWALLHAIRKENDETRDPMETRREVDAELERLLYESGAAYPRYPMPALRFHVWN